MPPLLSTLRTIDAPTLDSIERARQDCIAARIAAGVCASCGGLLLSERCQDPLCESHLGPLSPSTSQDSRR